jgi:hypothetical protein
VLYDPNDFYGPDAALAPRHDTLRQRIAAELGAIQGRAPKVES